jgi:Niemann-Pick C1 protein
MALISGFGIASAFGFKISNTLITIPFLVVGLGVDDMFVIMGTLKKVRSKHQQLPLPQIIGLTLLHSGTSITITSVTNVVVFLVGITTVIPSLSSYYFTASICIFMTYFYVVIFVVAVVTLDERRIEEQRNFLVPCITHRKSKAEEVVSSEEAKESFALRAIEYVYREIILTRVGKVQICDMFGHL